MYVACQSEASSQSYLSLTCTGTCYHSLLDTYSVGESFYEVTDWAHYYLALHNACVFHHCRGVSNHSASTSSIDTKPQVAIRGHATLQYHEPSIFSNGCKSKATCLGCRVAEARRATSLSTRTVELFSTVGSVFVLPYLGCSNPRWLWGGHGFCNV